MRVLVGLLGMAAIVPLAMSASLVAADTPIAAAPMPDLATARQAIATLADEIERSYVFPATAKAYAARLRAQLAAGAYDHAADPAALSRLVTADLQAIAPDGHLRMRPPLAPTPASGAVPARAPAAAAPPIEQPGLIAPGVAYIRFNAFLGGDETQQVAAFLKQYAGAKTLIIDARTHHGGGLDEVDVLLPQLYATPFTAMVLETRASVANGVGRLPFTSLVPVASPLEIVRLEHRIMPGPASPWRSARIFLLTSGRTASVAEHFATVLKNTGRATLIGETTAGAGNYGRGIPLPGGYDAFVPFGHSYFPGTAGWEGTGVMPDVAVKPERALVEALTRAGVPAAEAERLSASHMPAEPMVRRQPLRS